MLVVACSGSEGARTPDLGIGADDTSLNPDPSSPTTTATEGVSVVEATRLWEATLDLFETPASDRATAAAAAPDGVPTTEILDLAERYFLLDDELIVTSQARYEQQPDGSVTIIDCANTNGPTFLGATTLGFTATATPTPEGGAAITTLEPVAYCVPADDGQAALDTYQQWADDADSFWDDPRPDHPSLTENQTEAAMAKARQFYDDLVEYDILEGNTFNGNHQDRIVEIISYLPDQILIRECIHGDETYGTFDINGERVDGMVPPWQVQYNTRMLKVGDQWLYDDTTGTAYGECDLDRSFSSHQLL